MKKAINYTKKYSLILICVLTIVNFSHLKFASAEDTQIVFEVDSLESRNFEIEIDGVSKCFFGDLDALLLDIVNSNGTLGLQLTVEALPLSLNRVYFGVPKENMNNSSGQSIGTYRVSIPKKDKSAAFMVFVCSAYSTDKLPVACSKMQLVDINTAMMPYRVESSTFSNSQAHLHPSKNVQASGGQILPKNYFAQPVLAVNNSFSTISADIQNEDFLVSLESYGVSRKESSLIYADYSYYNKTLGSMPFALSGGLVSVQMPFFDSKRCAGF